MADLLHPIPHPTSPHQPRRDVYLSFVPDEETDTGLGMGLLCESEEVKELNVGVALDEGLAREDGDMVIYYGERHCYWINVS